MLIAIPSNAPGGLNATVADHFGHCDAFTLVEINSSEVKSVRIMPNQGHVQGGCMAPVMMLKRAGADAMVAGGMGMRPLAGFQQVGIDVYFNDSAASVGEAVKRVIEGKARPFGPAQVCGGGPGGNHGGGQSCRGH